MSGVHDEVGHGNHPRARLQIRGQVSQAPLLRFGRAMNSLAQDVGIGVEHDVEHFVSGLTQPSEDLFQVPAVQDGLRGDEILAGELGQFCGRGDDKPTPRGPVLEVGHWVVSKVGLQHVAHRFRVEHAARWDQETQFSGSGGLAAAKGPIQPDDHSSMLREARLHLLRLRVLTGGWAGSTSWPS